MAAFKPQPIRRGFTFAHTPEPLNANMTGAGELRSTVGTYRHLVAYWATSF